MEISYWQSRWQKNKIGWHMEVVYPQLPKLWSILSLKKGARVFVPLCGKSLDMKWLAEQGYYVFGVDVSGKALHEFMDIVPQSFSENSSHGFSIYRSKSIELWEGDFMKLPVAQVSKLDAIYDKASIVALPADMRKMYAHKLLELCINRTQILLQTFTYDQDEMNGPPFSVNEEEIRQLFGHRFNLQLLHEQSKLEELKKFQRRGLSSYLIEQVYHLNPLS